MNDFPDFVRFSRHDEIPEQLHITNSSYQIKCISALCYEQNHVTFIFATMLLFGGLICLLYWVASCGVHGNANGTIVSIISSGQSHPNTRLQWKMYFAAAVKICEFGIRWECHNDTHVIHMTLQRYTTGKNMEYLESTTETPVFYILICWKLSCCVMDGHTFCNVRN